MMGINFQRTYPLNETYESIKERANQFLSGYLRDPSLITFNDLERSVTFSTERLIPAISTNKPRIMLLFSNPHPNSVQQGMFLSPNSRGRANLFWSSMEESGWIIIAERNPDPKPLADICLNVKYQGPFELIFYCYYAFPTAYPEDIHKIFGMEYFIKNIEMEAIAEFRKTIQETSVAAVVTFNKEVFNLVSKDPIEHYVERLMEGEIIQSQIDGIHRTIPIFLTFPTGWRYHRRYRQFRKASLDAIKADICRELNLPENQNT
jgi:hypothetical protein